MHSQVLVVCKQDKTVVSMDADSLDVRWQVDLSDTGHEVVVSTDGALGFVPLYGTGGVGRPGRSGDGIDVVDLRTGTWCGTIPLPSGSRPHCAAWSRDEHLLVTAEGMGAVLAVDVAASMQPEGAHRDAPVAAHSALPTAHPQSHMLAVAPAGGHVYTADVYPGTITELEVSTGRRRSLPLTERINRISLSDDGATAYVADQVRPRLAVVDLQTMTLERWLALPGIGFGTATSGPTVLIVALRKAGQLVLLDLESGHVVRGVSVPSGPQRVVVSPSRRRAYTTCSPADRVVAVDLDSMQVVAEGSPGRDPDGLDVSV